MSRLCRDLAVKCGVDPAALRGVGKVIRDIAIERGWDRDTFNGFDQSLLNRLNTFYADSNELFAQRHWGVAWRQLFPERPAAQRVYLGPGSDSERQEMRQLMVLALRRLGFPLRRRRGFFKLYDVAVWVDRVQPMPSRLNSFQASRGALHSVRSTNGVTGTAAITMKA